MRYAGFPSARGAFAIQPVPQPPVHRAVQPSLPGHLRVEEGLVEHALPPPERVQHVEREHGQVELVEGMRDLASFTLRAIP